MAALLPDVRRPMPGLFDELLVRVAEWALLACAAWLWAVTLVVVVEAATRSGAGRRALRPRRLPGVPAALRRLVLVACGAAVVTGLAGPALADDVHLPTAVAQRLAERFDHLPIVPTADVRIEPHGHSRAASRGVVRRTTMPASVRETTVVVRPGDSLWSIAGDELGSAATDTAITARWHEIYARNRQVVGSDPGLLEPGQRLSLSELSLSEEERHD